MSPGDLPAPVFYMNTFHAQDDEPVFFHCSIDRHIAATRIVFCKDGVEVYSLKAQQGQLSYVVVLKVNPGSSGMYTCRYQHRNKSNWVRSSALSASWNLTVTGGMLVDRVQFSPAFATWGNSSQSRESILLLSCPHHDGKGRVVVPDLIKSHSCAIH
ncbi:hypothetical protein QYF61_027713 [Mycteria americana]|uniref:Ig-like domain-containing protein n=1 Tax=Mycteria americana TaxID=33587 RepID=A0AAN7MJ37_MYCAM|nr:hypothetical protein QYF61_027713 [Mycteria americana]